MGSSNLDQLGQGHVVYGSVTGAAGTDAVLTCNDNSATLTATAGATGVFTVTFGDVFLSAPVVTASIIDATLAATEILGVEVTTAATNAVTFQTWNSVAGTDPTTVGAGLAFGFIACGKRNN